MSNESSVSTSSIGAMWPPETASYDRIRGFYDQVVATPDDIDLFLKNFDAHKQLTDDHIDATRLSIRALVSLNALRALHDAHIQIEGGLPLRGDKDHMVVYMGWNSDDRSVPLEKISEQSELLKQVTQLPLGNKINHNDLLSMNLEPNIIGQDTSDNDKRRLIGKFTDLYAVFGYDENDVEELLLNPNNSIAYFEQDNKIVSTAMAEKAIVDIEGHGRIKLTEITEAITRPNHRGKGLYKAISGYLINTLENQDSEQMDVIYGETNLAMEGVLIAAHQNGRRFSHFDAGSLGISQLGFGILPQNFSIKDGTETRQYNDFALSYLPLN